MRVIAHVGMLTAGAKGKILFEWQLTGDGGVTWSAAPPTTYGRADFEGLTPMHVYGFRVRFSDQKGAHEWSQMLTYLVL